MDPEEIAYLESEQAALRREIPLLHAQLALAIVSLEHCDRALGLFSPRAVQPLNCQARSEGPRLLGDIGNVIKKALQQAGEPLSTADICTIIMARQKLDATDKTVRKLMMKRTLANLKHWRERGDIGSIKCSRSKMLWTLA